MGLKGASGGQAVGQGDREDLGRAGVRPGGLVVGVGSPATRLRRFAGSEERLGPGGAGPATWQAAIPALGAPPPAAPAAD